MNTIPNFDAMAREDINIWLNDIGWTGRIARVKAAALIGDKRPGYTTIAGDFRSYAVNRFVAMRLREQGNIETAQIYENICDRIYSKLPIDLRW